MGVRIFYKIFFTFNLNVGIVCRILLIVENNVMDLNYVMILNVVAKQLHFCCKIITLLNKRTVAVAKQLHFYFSWLTNWRFSYFGAHNIPLEKVLNIPFQRYIQHPKTYHFAIAKWKIKFCSHIVTANHGGQKNRNGKTIAVHFRHVFY